MISTLARMGRNPHTRRSAFTFLEIMFVVVIIGILLAIVGPRLARRGAKARTAACRAQIHNFKVALASYELEVGQFPDSNQGLKALIERPSEVDENAWDGPYFDGQAIPKDPWGNEYQYKSPGEHNKDYDLWSFGPDRQDNTEDDVRNWTEEKQ
jgi:general secretion pathway protein G